MKKIIYWMILLMPVITVEAQSKSGYERVNYTESPVWIAMMEEEGVIFNEVVNAFESFWQGKEVPESLEELMSEGKLTEIQAKEKRSERGQWTQEQRNDFQEMIYQVKRYKDWKRSNLPFLLPDGRIMTQQEKTDLWNKQQNDLKAIDKKEK